ncbi:hypothetical protein GXP71_02855 [Cellulomonas sp. H30R-01]|nr:hypothetical protein GXP71_02855 [Cellulomonas sp. H30R-01]
MRRHVRTARRLPGAALAAGLTRRWLTAAASGRDRGDVPGWVLVTLMTAGLVTALWLVAEPALSQVFDDAITSVTGD